MTSSVQFSKALARVRAANYDIEEENFTWRANRKLSTSKDTGKRQQAGGEERSKELTNITKMDKTNNEGKALDNVKGKGKQVPWSSE